MPRPKPPEPLRPRNIRLSDTHWYKLQRLGGAEWLRHTITRSYNNGVSPLKQERNRRVRVDRAAGLSVKDIAEKHRLSERTVFRILDAG